MRENNFSLWPIFIKTWSFVRWAVVENEAYERKVNCVLFKIINFLPSSWLTMYAGHMICLYLKVTKSCLLNGGGGRERRKPKGARSCALLCARAAAQSRLWSSEWVQPKMADGACAGFWTFQFEKIEIKQNHFEISSLPFLSLYASTCWI